MGWLLILSLLHLPTTSYLLVRASLSTVLNLTYLNGNIIRKNVDHILILYAVINYFIINPRLKDANAWQIIPSFSPFSLFYPCFGPQKKLG